MRLNNLKVFIALPPQPALLATISLLIALRAIIFERQEFADVDRDRLVQALDVLKMARLEAMGRRHRRMLFGATLTGQQWMERQDAIRAALTALSRGGVDIDRAPQEALDLALDAHTPPDDHPALHPRGARRR